MQLIGRRSGRLGTLRRIGMGTFLILAMGYLSAAAAQPENQQEAPSFDPKTTTRLTLGATAGTPGTSVVVPVYFTPADGVEVGSLKLSVSFVSINLKFEKVEQGIAGELGNVNLTAAVETDKNEKGIETSKLTVLASFPPGETPKKGFPAGLLAYLTFRIGEDVKASSISLTASAEATEIASGANLQEVLAFGTNVEIQAPGTLPMSVCFFFTH